MFRISLTGALGADAEVRETGKHKVINFSVAVHKAYKNSDGEKVEKTEWVRATMWRNADASTKVAQYLKKGTKVLIEGEPQADAYLSKEGDAVAQLKVNVKELDLLN